MILEPKMALCGNGVVEEGEECDCGWEEDCEEECCWPQRTDYPAGQKPCTLRPNKPCSPTQVMKMRCDYLRLDLKLFCDRKLNFVKRIDCILTF